MAIDNNPSRETTNQIETSPDSPVNTEKKVDLPKEQIAPKQLNKKLMKNLETTLQHMGQLGKKLKDSYTKEDLLKLYENEILIKDGKSDESIDFIRLLLENRENVLNIISSTQDKTFRQSRELIDNKLAREQTETKQLSLFDHMDQKGNLIPSSTAPEPPVIRGLDFTPGEDRLIHTLSLLLSRHSEKWNQQSPNYYMGNFERGVTTINSVDLETARLMITPHDLYSTYLGRTDYNTDHIQFILQSLSELSKKNFLVTLTIPKESNQKGKRFDKLRTYLPLFQVVILNKDLTETESQQIENNDLLVEGKGCKFLFRFNPIFTNSIRERYVEFPEDIHLRIARSAGQKGKVSQSTNLLRDFLFREKQQKRFTIVRDEDTLLNILNLEKMRKEGRKKKVNEMLQKSFDIFVSIGLLKDVQKSIGKKGQTQYTMEINPDFK